MTRIRSNRRNPLKKAGFQCLPGRFWQSRPRMDVPTPPRDRSKTMTARTDGLSWNATGVLAGIIIASLGATFTLQVWMMSGVNGRIDRIEDKIDLLIRANPTAPAIPSTSAVQPEARPQGPALEQTLPGDRTYRNSDRHDQDHRRARHRDLPPPVDSLPQQVDHSSSFKRLLLVSGRSTGKRSRSEMAAQQGAPRGTLQLSLGPLQRQSRFRMGS